MRRLLIIFAALTLLKCHGAPLRGLEGRLYWEGTFVLGEVPTHSFERLVEFGPGNTWREIVSADYVGENYPEMILRAPLSGRYSYEVVGTDRALLTFLSGPTAGARTLVFDSDADGRIQTPIVSGRTRVGRFTLLDPVSRYPLVNTSTRAFLDYSHPLLSGFVVGADSFVLVRAVGPSLSAFGVRDSVRRLNLTVVGPTETARSTSIPSVRYSNERWSTSLGDVTRMSQLAGAFPLPSDSQDAAMVLQLSRGTYTAEVTCPEGESGYAHLEVYVFRALQP